MITAIISLSLVILVQAITIWTLVRPGEGIPSPMTLAPSHRVSRIPMNPGREALKKVERERYDNEMR